MEAMVTIRTAPEYFGHVKEYFDRKIKAAAEHQEANRRYEDSRMASIHSFVLEIPKNIDNLANLVELYKMTVSVILNRKE